MSPDGAWIASAGGDGALRTWDAETGAERRTLTSTDGGVHGCAISPDGSQIVTGSDHRTLAVWDALSGTEAHRLAHCTGEAVGHLAWVRAFAVSPDGAWIVSGGGSGALKMWDADTGRELRTLSGDGGSVVTGCAISPDGAWMVSSSQDHTLTIWDVPTGTVRRLLTGHIDWVNGCAISPDGTWIASASQDRTVKVWDAATGAVRRTLTGHTAAVSGCAIGPDGTWIASVSTDRTLRVWDAGSGRQLVTVPLPAPLTCVAVDPRRSAMVCGDEGGALHLLDLIGVDAPALPPETGDTIDFYPEGLLHKFGFGDGDMLCDLMDEHGLQVDRSDLLAAVVGQLVVPRLDQRVETYTLVSMHNPIRALTVDGEPADIDSDLTPDVIAVPVAEILAVARTLPPREHDEEDGW